MSLNINKYVDKKLEYYGLPIRLIQRHSKWVLWVFLTFEAIIIAFTLFTKNYTFATLSSVSIALRAIYILSMLISIFAFPLLDKTTFFVNVCCCGFSALFNLYLIVEKIIVFVNYSNSPITSGRYGNLVVFPQWGYTAYLLVFYICVICYFIAVIISFISHKELFFKSFKQLKNECSANYIDETGMPISKELEAAIVGLMELDSLEDLMTLDGLKPYDSFGSLADFVGSNSLNDLDGGLNFTGLSLLDGAKDSK